MRFCRWVLTVLADRLSRSATAWRPAPSARQARTTRSRGVSAASSRSPSSCLSRSRSSRPSTFPVSDGGSQVSPATTPRTTRSRCSSGSSLRTQADACARIASTIRSGSDDRLSMITRGASSRPDSSSHRRFAAPSPRSASSRMTSACLPTIRHWAGVLAWTAATTSTSSSASSRAASASAKVRSLSMTKALIPMAMIVAHSHPPHYLSLPWPCLRQVEEDGHVRGQPPAGTGPARSGGGVLTEQTLPGREGGSLKPAVHAELGEHVLHIGAERADGDVHLPGHLPRSLAADHPAQHFLLPRGQLTGRERVPVPALALAGCARQRGIERPPARGDHVERVSDLADAVILAEKPRHADPRSPGPRRQIADAGQHEHFRAGTPPQDRLGRGEAVVPGGKAQIQQDGIGLVPGHRRDAGVGGRGGRHDLMTLCPQRGTECLAQDPVVVAQNEPHKPPLLLPRFLRPGHRSRQPEADARPAEGGAAALQPPPVPGHAPGHGGQAESVAGPDAPESGTAVLDGEHRPARAAPDFQCHRARRTRRPCRVTEHVRDHAAEYHRMDTRLDGAGGPCRLQLARPGQALRGGRLPGHPHHVGPAGSRLSRISWRGTTQPVLDHVCQPSGLVGNLLKARTGGARQVRLGQRRRREREHAGYRLPHVVACLPHLAGGALRIPHCYDGRIQQPHGWHCLHSWHCQLTIPSSIGARSARDPAARMRSCQLRLVIKLRTMIGKQGLNFPYHYGDAWGHARVYGLPWLPLVIPEISATRQVIRLTVCPGCRHARSWGAVS